MTTTRHQAHTHPAPRFRPTAPPIDTRRIVIGEPPQLANVIANHRRTGTLISAESLWQYANRPEVAISLHTRTPAPTRHPGPPPTSAPSMTHPSASATPANRPTRVALIVTAVAAPILGVIAVGAYLLGALVAFIQAHAATIGGLAALALLIAAALTGTRRKRHCPGC